MKVTIESVVETLSAMERYFRGGERWIKGALSTRHGKCLVGAVTSVRASNGSGSWVPGEAIAAALSYIDQAVIEREGRGGVFRKRMTIEAFNDSRPSFAEVAAVIARAKELARADFRRQLPPPSAVPQVPLQQPRPALTYQPERPVEVITMADMQRVAVKRR